MSARRAAARPRNGGPTSSAPGRSRSRPGRSRPSSRRASAAPTRPGEVTPMKAVLEGRIIAESDDIVAEGGYHYFPNAHVRTALLDRTERTASDLRCPHGVQFYDVVIDGKRYARAAWRYEAPL